MVNVKVFHCLDRAVERWRPIIERLEEFDIRVHGESSKADISIVLGGQFENPLALTGKKILFYNKKDFRSGWEIYKFVLTEYYDELIDTTEMGGDQIVKEVLNKIRRIE